MYIAYPLKATPAPAGSGADDHETAAVDPQALVNDKGEYFTQLPSYTFSPSLVPETYNRRRPRDKFGKELYSRRRVPAFTSSALHHSTSNPASEAIVSVKPETRQHKAKSTRKPKHQPKKGLTTAPTADKTAIQINQLIHGKDTSHHHDLAPIHQKVRSRALIDLDSLPLTSHIRYPQPTSSLSHDWNQPPDPQLGHPHNPRTQLYNPQRHKFRPKASKSKLWRTQKDMNMESQYVPPHLRRGYNCNLSSTKVAGGDAAEATADHIRLALRGRPIPDGSSRVNQHSPRVVRQVFPAAGTQPLSQYSPTLSNTPGQQQGPDSEVQETSPASTKQAAGTTRVDNDTPASSPPSYQVKKQPVIKKVGFQVAARVGPSKGYKWPKNKDMRPPAKSSSSSDGGASVRSNSNGDPTYDIRKLTDWEGNWLPAPVEWEGRGGFSDRNFFDRLETWISNSERVSKENMDMGDPAFAAEVNGEVAPRFWIPTAIDAESPQNFWRMYQSRAPAPLSDCDLTEQPWWETYTSPTSAILPPVAAPEAKLDTVEMSYDVAIKDFGSNGAIKKREDAKKVKEFRAAERRRRKAQERKFQPPAELFMSLDRSLKPQANIYLRPAYPADITQITDLYNYYVTNTIHCPERTPRTTQDLINHLTAILTSGLPWIVAVDRSKGTGLHSSWVTHIPEKIIGVAYADEFCDSDSMFRYTAELTILVDPECCHKGIGSCLMDKILNIMDTGYQARTGYEWIVKAGESTSIGNRVVKTVLCQVPYDAGDGTEITWTTKFLQSFNFRKAGDIQFMGFKRDRTINMATFQYVTGEDINV
ncbi:hypothetical protein AOQ84DRAFT_403705 [Glonium stellatum]|uniref:N-acetyltransferase domain-containing protein n=1 Tax=Glonium stellatum TaxID=574774 RepID=A0A8E2JUJ9_9PEZI|nr:hypothetical protein AOQ84DRAFT_403705 [Glonium stellatum]